MTFIPDDELRLSLVLASLLAGSLLFRIRSLRSRKGHIPGCPSLEGVLRVDRALSLCSIAWGERRLLLAVTGNTCSKIAEAPCCAGDPVKS